MGSTGMALYRKSQIGALGEPGRMPYTLEELMSLCRAMHIRKTFCMSIVIVNKGFLTVDDYLRQGPPWTSIGH